MRAIRSLAAGAAAGLSLATAAIADPSPPAPGLRLAFSDEFDGTTLSPAWATSFKSGERRLTGESQVYLDPSDPAGTVTVGGGRLTLTARPAIAPVPGFPDATHVSGMVSSHLGFTPTYGYFEARIRIPAGRGLWPAFWLLRSDGIKPYGEIDVMEALGHDTSTTYATLHMGPEHATRKMRQVEAKAADYGSGSFADGFHVFAVDWGPDRTRYLVDGRETASFPTAEELRAPMHVMLNLAVGGEWAGKPDEPLAFPARMEIDWVRVWERTSAPVVPPAAREGEIGSNPRPN